MTSVKTHCHFVVAKINRFSFTAKLFFIFFNKKSLFSQGNYAKRY